MNEKVLIIFVSNEQFDYYVKEDAFIGGVQVHTNRYGTLKVQVEAQCDRGNNVFLEIDTQSKKVRKKFPGVFSIFIAPPTLEDLAKRLQKRNTEAHSELQHRWLMLIKNLLKLAIMMLY